MTSMAVKVESEVVMNDKPLSLKELLIAEIKAANAVEKFYKVGERGVCDHTLLKFAWKAEFDVIGVDWMMQNFECHVEDQIFGLYMKEVKLRMKSGQDKKLLEILSLDTFAETFKAPYEKLKAQTVAKFAKKMDEQKARHLVKKLVSVYRSRFGVEHPAWCKCDRTASLEPS
jgi:hypothetical protein